MIEVLLAVVANAAIIGVGLLAGREAGEFSEGMVRDDRHSMSLAEEEALREMHQRAVLTHERNPNA